MMFTYDCLMLLPAWYTFDSHQIDCSKLFPYFHIHYNCKVLQTTLERSNGPLQSPDWLVVSIVSNLVACSYRTECGFIHDTKCLYWEYILSNSIKRHFHLCSKWIAVRISLDSEHLCCGHTHSGLHEQVGKNSHFVHNRGTVNITHCSLPTL